MRRCEPFLARARSQSIDSQSGSGISEDRGYSTGDSGFAPRSWTQASLRVSRKLHAIRKMLSNEESPRSAESSPTLSSDTSSERSAAMSDVRSSPLERPQTLSNSAPSAKSTTTTPTHPVLTISSDASSSLDADGSRSPSSPNGDRKKGESELLSPLPSRTASRKQKYFSEDHTNKSVFKKYFHPSFHQRSLQFRKLFSKNLPEEEQLLYSFSCAYQREILAQGRMFISQRHVSFYANIFSWETNFSIPIKDITTITKERAAKIFPNSIQIETSLGDKYFFASFVNREKSYSVLNKVWTSVQGGSVISPEDLWEWMNVDAEEREKSSSAKKKSASPDALAVSKTDASHKNSSAPALGIPAPEFPAEFPSTPVDGTISRTSSSDTAADEVVCPCESHQGKLLVDGVYSISVDQLFSLLFSETPWFQHFADSLQGTVHARQNDNVSGYAASAWATNKAGVKQRTCTYTMALNYSMGPKSCIVTEKQSCTHFARPSDGFVVHKETTNAGVPYADSFAIHCSYCVTRVGDGESRLRIHGGIVYRKSIWSVIRSHIEKSTYQGLDERYNALEAVLDQHCGGAASKGQKEDTLTVENAHIVYEKLDQMRERQRSLSSGDELDSPIRPKTLPTSVSANFNYVPAERNDEYGLYIRVIVGLLLGLVVLNLLLLVRVYSIDTSPRVTLSEQLLEALRGGDVTAFSSQQEAVLDALIHTVNKMSADLSKLRSKKEL